MIELYLALGILGLVYYSKNNDTLDSNNTLNNKEHFVDNKNNKNNKNNKEPTKPNDINIALDKFMIRKPNNTVIGEIIRNDKRRIKHIEDARFYERNGADNYYNCKKTEIERNSFFTPFKNLSSINAKKNVNDRTQERLYTTRNRNGELPFEQIRVGQGINGKYDNAPSGGFHDINTQELVKPKTVDELRTLSNPKLQFKGRVISGKNNIDMRANKLKVDKNRPETAFLHGYKRFFKTTGANLKASVKENFEAKPTNRQIHKQFIGIAKGSIKKTSDITVQKSNRNNLKNTKPINKTSSNQWKENSKLSNYGKEGFVAYPNERDITQKRTYKSNIITAFKAIIAPIVDTIKETKKEQVEINSRPEGNFSISGPKNLTSYDPNDIAKTTIKETTIDNNRKGIAKGNIKAKIYKKDTLPKITIRNTLDFVDSNINMNPNRPNKSKTFSNQPIKTTVKQTTIDNKYIGQANNEKGDGYMVANAKAPNTNRQFYTDTEYSGSANSSNHKSTDQASFNNASLNINKEVIARGRKPTLSGPKTYIDKSKINTMLKKQMSEVKNNTVFKDIDYIKTSSETPVVLSHSKDTLNNSQNTDRIKPEILDAYRKNPFTQSLHSYTNALPVSNEQDENNPVELTEEEKLNNKIKEEIDNL